MKIRPAIINDLPNIMDILNNEIVHGTAIWDYEAKPFEYYVEWFETRKKKGMPIIVAATEYKVYGFGSFDIMRPKEGYKYCVEHSIYVSKDAQGKGTGKALMDELIAVAKKDGYHTMVAWIDGLNEASIKFHQKFGFKEIGRLKEAGFKFDKWLDVVFMQLFF